MSGQQAMDVIAELAKRGVRVATLAIDSRRVAPGDVFLAYPGAASDGRGHIAAAVAKGAAAVLWEAEAARVADPGVPGLAVPGLARLSGELAHLVYGRPSERLWLAGVTGTNGKTSVSQWIAQALGHLGRPCAVIGTLGNGFPGRLADSPNTTPDAVTLHRSLAAFLAEGAAACAMEVSSIGLDQDRVAGARIDTAVFTNLTRDHLEYHGSMEAYAAAKARLFDQPGLRSAVLNLDDAFGRELAARHAGRLRVIGYSLEGRRDGAEAVAAENLRLTPTGVAFDLVAGAVRHGVAAAVTGRFNVANLLAVAGALRAAGIPLADAAGVLSRLTPPPGRLELVAQEGRPLVVVDYAHTPDALEKALTTLRELAKARGGRLHCVFGCGGERDPGKRPLMGAVAERLADVVWLTDDNPRGEEPAAIIAAIRAGMGAAPNIEAERAAAIRAAVAGAAPHDVVLVAGKGHEPYQEVGGVRHPFSDVAEARRALEATC